MVKRQRLVKSALQRDKMFETLDNYINEILNEKPAFRDLVTSTYALLSDEQKRILNELLETPFNETLKDDILVILNSKDLDTLKQNVSEFLEKYPVAQNYKDEIMQNSKAMEIANDFTNLLHLHGCIHYRRTLQYSIWSHILLSLYGTKLAFWLHHHFLL